MDDLKFYDGQDVENVKYYREMADRVLELLAENNQESPISRDEIAKRLYSEEKITEDSKKMEYNGKNPEDVLSIEAIVREVKKDMEKHTDPIMIRSMEEYIRKVEDSVLLYDLERDIKVPPFLISDKKVDELVRKTRYMISVRSKADLHRVRLTLNKYNQDPSKKIVNNQFMYGLCKYIRKNYENNSVYIENILLNITYLDDYPKLQQNTTLIYSLERLFRSKFIRK